MKYRLGDICTIQKGETGIMKAIPGPYTMVALGEANKTHSEFQFDTKAVIIPLVSSTGHGHASMKRVKYHEGKFALGNILCAVIPKDENFVLAKYLHIYLHWNKEELLVSQMKGMANVSLPMNRIADVVVIVPSLEKQKEIIELEKKLVDRELKADKLFADQLTQLENLKQTILQEAVQGKLVKQDPKDEPANELLKRIKVEKAKSGKKEKPLPPIKPEEIPFEIPENWVWCRLGEIIHLIMGQSPESDTYNKKGLGLPFYQGKTEFGEMFPTTVRVWCTKPTRVSQINDILISVRAPVGDVNISDKEYATGRGLSILRCLNNDLHYLYLFYFLDFFKRKWNSKGSFFQAINRDHIELQPFPFPPLSDQKRIVAEIEKQLSKTKQVKEHIIANQQATKQLLKALLYQTFEVEGGRRSKQLE